MPKMKDLGINVIPETMRPPECLPLTVGPVCHPGGVTHNPCWGCSLDVTHQCITHTTITICYTGTICPMHSIVTCPVGTICHFGTGCPGGTYCHGGTYCPGGSACTFGTQPGTITITPTTPQILQGGGLTHESIGQLKQQLQDQIKALDEHAKTLGPQTTAEIDAREKQLKMELDGLAARRNELKKK